MRLKILSIALFFAFFGKTAMAQTPVEIFGGHEKATLDLLFFKFFKKADGTNSRFLFFNRNRTSVDYRITKTAFLPQFGSTNAVSFNLKKWGGFAPVAVVQIFNRGIFPKAGVQFFKRKSDLTFFSWAVVELLEKPSVDWFVLARFEPKLTEKTRLFAQFELVAAFLTDKNLNQNFIERGRLGLKKGVFQFGFGADFNQNGRGVFSKTDNLGGFLRHEF
jgi:hypothetical protein